jgi:phosphatidylserine/phosphatidylglycerophosphate/cardiolipin synthase-like enzyme
VVASLEDQFAERWIINAGKVSPFKRESDFPSVNEVTVTSAQAIKGGQMAPLEPSVPVAPAGDATVQVWRTIPVYPGRDKTTGPFRRGEFTIMAGVAKAVAQARHLITIWDQYFWSAPLARLLANQLNTTPTLRLLIVLPPYGTGHPKEELGLRKYAVEELYGHLTAEARSRVMMRNMWDHDSDIGIYVHDKVQTYDDALLVCGSANMNRRSFECDAELDCAVLHAPTVRSHLARLYASLAGESWVDFGPGWLGRYWESFGYGGIIDQVFYSKWLIKDPFFQPPEADIPPLPNGLKITTRDALKEQWRWVLDPSGFKADLESVGGEPDINQVGRLDGITYLLEKYDKGGTWPMRTPFSW